MGIHVNFNDDEINSEARSYEALPTGEYKVAITKVDLKEVSATDADGKPKKNAGKPFYNVEMTVQEENGKYEGSKLWGTVMLFDGAAYSLAQIMKTMGRTPGTDDVPSIEDLTGHKMTAVVLKSKDEYAMKKAGDMSTVLYKAEVKGYKSWGAASSSGAQTKPAGKVTSGGAPLP